MWRRLCQGSCGTNFESTKGDNVIKAIPDVKLERDCKSNCLENEDCLYYTYYGRLSDHNSYLCILLSKLLGTAQECKHCVTSVPNCRNNSCKFTVNSNKTLLNSYLFTNVDSLANVTFLPSTSLICKATVIAIGGGGAGGQSSFGLGGGGGSGYVQSVVFDISSTEYQVSVGQNGYESFVKKKDDNNITWRVITAQPGGDGSQDFGGDGYSGGGGHKIGGSNGSDGHGYSGGVGMALDITSVSLEYHVLNPGEGGQPCTHGQNFGGGGGGILVDNFGPNSDYHTGKGYGGGGGGYSGAIGLQGMVLIEVKPKFENIIL